MAKKVSIINFKGGVGKSTLAFHLATYLARESRVLLIDVDHQSSLSLVLMGDVVWQDAVNSRSTVNKIFESFCNRKVVMPGDEIIHRSVMMQRRPTRKSLYPNLDLVPAQFELDDTEIEMASTTMGSPVISEWHKRTLMAEWLDSVDVDSNYDYVIFDCPPATKLVSQNALAASDYYVVPVVPDIMSSRGVTHFQALVDAKIDKKLEFLRASAGIAPKDVPRSYRSVTKMAGIVPFLAKPSGNAASGLTNIHTEQLAALRTRWGANIIKQVVTSLTGVPEAVDQGLPLWAAPASANRDRALPMMENACKQIIARFV